MATYEPHMDRHQQQQQQQQYDEKEDWTALPPQETRIDCGVDNQLEFTDDTMHAASDDAAAEASPSVAVADIAKQAWQWACWSGEKTWDGLDFAGEVVANFLGLTRSKYQWMIDIQEREDEERRLHKLEARQRRQLRLEQLLEQEKRKLAMIEAGNDSLPDNQFDDYDDLDDYDFDTDDEDNNNNSRDDELMLMDMP